MTSFVLRVILPKVYEPLGAAGASPAEAVISCASGSRARRHFCIIIIRFMEGTDADSNVGYDEMGRERGGRGDFTSEKEGRPFIHPLHHRGRTVRFW